MGELDEVPASINPVDRIFAVVSIPM